MQRFFVEPHQIDEEAHQIHITGTDVNHIANVLRMKQGEEVWISDGGQKEYRCAIEAFSADEVLLHIIYAQEPDYELPSRIYLFQGLPKADKMEYIIQKNTELGAKQIVPVEMVRCVVKLDSKKEGKKIERWQKIAESAAKQSGRDLIPTVEMPIDINNLCEKIKDFDAVILAYEEEKENTLKNELKKLDETKNLKIGVIIGPEGGIDKTEIEKLANAGAKVVTLGKRILRTETASISIMSNIVYEFEL